MGVPSKTKIKEYWDAQPCNINHSKLKVGTPEYYRETITWRNNVEPHLAPFADFPKWNGKRVLEIGCGIGADAQQFIEAGAVYTGIELSPVSLNLAIDRLQTFNLTGELLEMDAELIEKHLPKNYYDLVYSMGVIHHTPHPDKVINGASVVIKTRGTLKFMVYAENSWKSMMIDAGLDQYEAQAGCPLAYTYDDDDIEQLLYPYFTIESIERDHIFMYDLEKYKQKQLELTPWFAAMPEYLREMMRKNLGWHWLVTAKLRNR